MIRSPVRPSYAARALCSLQRPAFLTSLPCEMTRAGLGQAWASNGAEASPRRVGRPKQTRRFRWEARYGTSLLAAEGR